MAEFAALRTILLNECAFQASNGQRLLVEQVLNLIERADADKLKKALERLRIAKDI